MMRRFVLSGVCLIVCLTTCGHDDGDSCPDRRLELSERTLCFGDRAVVIPFHVPSQTAIGDIDGDGSSEILAADEDASATLRMFVHSSGGAFAQKHTLPLWQDERVADGVFVDLGDDPSPELVVWTVSSIADGDTHVGIVDYQADTDQLELMMEMLVPTPAVAVADVDADGDVDIVIGDSQGELQLMRNLGSLTFEPVLLDTFERRIKRVGAGDVNGDGVSDIVVLSTRSGANTSSIWLGRPATAPAPSATLDTWFHWVFDLDQDGFADLVHEYGFWPGRAELVLEAGLARVGFYYAPFPEQVHGSTLFSGPGYRERVVLLSSHAGSVQSVKGAERFRRESWGWGCGYASVLEPAGVARVVHDPDGCPVGESECLEIPVDVARFSNEDLQIPCSLDCVDGPPHVVFADLDDDGVPEIINFDGVFWGEEDCQ